MSSLASITIRASEPHGIYALHEIHERHLGPLMSQGLRAYMAIRVSISIRAATSNIAFRASMAIRVSMVYMVIRAFMAIWPPETP